MKVTYPSDPKGNKNKIKLMNIQVFECIIARKMIPVDENLPLQDFQVPSSALSV